MNAQSEDLVAPVERSASRAALDGRLIRSAVATLVVSLYVAIGFAFRLSADAYLLVGIPITVAFQLLIVRRPLRSLWLRQAPPMMFTPQSIAAVVVLAIAPAIVAARGVRDGDVAVVGWGVISMAGAVAAVYALRAMDRDAMRLTIRTTLIAGAVLVVIVAAYRL